MEQGGTATTITSRERVRRTLTFQGPDRVPRDLWTLGCIPRYHQVELDALNARFPSDFARAPVKYGESLRARPPEGSAGRHTDYWGATFEYLEEGVYGEVVDPLLADWAALSTLTPPDEVLDGLDLEPAHQFYQETDKFVICGATIQPWQQVMFLRGFANIMMDVGDERPELLCLLRILHEFYLRELHLLTPVSADAIQFKDDWGTELNLFISPRQWRKLFKPMYAEYCRIIHEAGKFVFFHSDGQISSIYPDLIEIGVDAINSQLFCMDIETLAQQHRGRITFWGEIDRRLLAFGTPGDVRSAVRRVRRALDRGQGGLIAQCEWGNDNPTENVSAVFEAWDEPLC